MHKVSTQTMQSIATTIFAIRITKKMVERSVTDCKDAQAVRFAPSW